MNGSSPVATIRTDSSPFHRMRDSLPVAPSVLISFQGSRVTTYWLVSASSRQRLSSARLNARSSMAAR